MKTEYSDKIAKVGCKVGNELTFLGFWAINDALEPARLRAQLDELKACGLDGVVFHPRFYPNDPPYMSEAYLAVVSDVILHARSLGMAFWIYDEDGWPSGTAGGQVMARRPESKCEWIALERDADGAATVGYRWKNAVSSFDEEATRLFIDITHEGYRKGLAPEAFDYAAGFFTDEVAFLDGHGITVKEGGLPWDPRMPALYFERHGEALEPLLPLLFEDGEGAAGVRVRYWELATDLLVAGYYEPVQRWCAAHGKKFTGHLKAEESPYFQLSYSGSAFRTLRGVETPAVDALERFPGNHFYPRIAHSIAMQQGRDGCLAEAMGGSGWGVSPASFEEYVLWLAGHGIGTFVLHLNQYKLKSQAIRDWPPSMPAHVSWRDAFPALLASLRAKAARLPDLRGEPDALIVTPTRGVMAAFEPEAARQMNEHDGSNAPDDAAGRLSERFLALVEACHAAGLHYELSEERAIELEGAVEQADATGDTGVGQANGGDLTDAAERASGQAGAAGKLRIGKRSYAAVLVPDGCVWRDAGTVQRLRDAGVRVLGEADWRGAFGVRGEADAAGETSGAEAAGPAGASASRAAGSGAGGGTGAGTGAGAGASIPEQSPWRVTPPDENLLFAALEPGSDGALAAEWRLDRPAGAGGADWELLLHDPVAEVRVNGTPLPLASESDLTVARIPAALLAAGARLRVEVSPLPGGEPSPFAYLRGAFSVRSESPLTDKDARQQRTAGPFAVAPSVADGAALTGADAADLIAAGYPFADRPAKAVKRLRLPGEADAAGRRMRLRLGDGIRADAARVLLDGREIGWCWGPDWSLELPADLGPGECELTAELYPSTFNRFGPHRHIDGDRHLTSPAQFAGERNFADRPDAPERTLGPDWHFVRWGIDGDVDLAPAK